MKPKQNIIKLSKSCIGKEERHAVCGVLEREYLGMGAEVYKFEMALQEFFGRPVVTVINGTAALQLAVQSCGFGTGDEILVPSLTYVASFQAISATGAIPIACDIDKDTCLIDLSDARQRLTKRTRGIMPVHYTGGVGDLDETYAFAKRNGLRVIEDAAHAFGACYKQRKIGSFGDISCFSFDGIKNITSGEGGCIVSGDKSVISKVEDLRLLGVERDTVKRFSGQRSWLFDVKLQGWRYHMSNIMAAIGIEQLKKFPKMAARRREIALRYEDRLKNCSKIKLLPRDYNEIVPHIYVVRILGLKNREQLQCRLKENGVPTGIHYQPNHQLSLYYCLGRPLPNTDEIFPELLTLPLHPDLKCEEVDWICKVLLEAL
jgi:dTDP-4-amino-4,6-dideoxygalactose transaminase